MTDKEISKLDEQEFDLYLEDIIDRPPPADIANDFKPWRKAMNRVLWGVGLTTLTLNFWNLDGYIVSSWFIFIHQHSHLQFPVQTAMEFEMTSFFNMGYAFKTIQTAFQFTTHGEAPELI